MSQQNPNRKFDPNNIPPMGDDKKKPKFNIYWIYGLIFVTIVGYNLFRTVQTAGIEISRQALPEMLKNGDILPQLPTAKNKTGIIAIKNKDIVRLYLRKENIQKNEAFYKNIIEDKAYEALKKVEQPQLYFTIGDADKFQEELSEIYKEIRLFIMPIRLKKLMPHLIAKAKA